MGGTRASARDYILFSIRPAFKVADGLSISKLGADELTAGGTILHRINLDADGITGFEGRRALALSR